MGERKGGELATPGTRGHRREGWRDKKKKGDHTKGSATKGYFLKRTEKSGGDMRSAGKEKKGKDPERKGEILQWGGEVLQPHV